MSNIQLRKNKFAYYMLSIMYYEKAMRIKDLRNTSRGTFTTNTSNAIRKLINYGFIEVSKEGVVKITKKGEVYILDKESPGSYEDLYQNEIGNDYTHLTDPKSRERYLDHERAKAMFYANGEGVKPKDKPSLPALCHAIASGVYDTIPLDTTRPPYLNISGMTETDFYNLFSRGFFYTKREIVDMLQSKIAFPQDLVNSSRISGLFISNERLHIVYVQPERTENMFKITHADSMVKQLIDEVIYNRYAGNFNRYKTECIVFSDGDSLVWSMATGWKRGVLSEGKKKMMYVEYNKRHSKNQNISSHYNETTGHVLVDRIYYPSIIDSLSDNEKLEMVKKELSSTVTANMSCLNYASSEYEHLYVVPASIKGIGQLKYVLYRNNEDISREAVALLRNIYPYADESNITDSKNHILTINGDTYIYIPYYDIMSLHSMSCDGDKAKTSILPYQIEEPPMYILTQPDMANAISHSLRRNIVFLDMYDMSEIQNIRRYNIDGYVKEGYYDPYAQRRKTKEEKKGNASNKRNIVSVAVNKEEYDYWKELAKKENITLNRFIKENVRIGLRTTYGEGAEWPERLRENRKNSQ